MALFAEREDQVEDLIRTYVTHNLAHHDEYVRPFPGVLETVTAVRDSGRVLGIVTSKKRRATRMGLVRCELPEEWFEAIVTADDVDRYKPEPDPVLEALRLLDAGPGEALFVGDSTHDMRSGRAAGVATAAVLWGPYSREQLEPTEPDMWLHEPGDLLEVLGLGG